MIQSRVYLFDEVYRCGLLYQLCMIYITVKTRDTKSMRLQGWNEAHKVRRSTEHVDLRHSLQDSVNFLRITTTMP